MKIVHFADTHLGYRNYARQTPRGLNQREVDVATAFSRVIDRTIEIKPELVVVAGDVFENVRPTNHSILHAYDEIRRLIAALPEVIIVMVAGNHDIPRTAETGCLLVLFRRLGVHVVHNKIERLSFRGGELSVLCVPEKISPLPKFEPDHAARFNVLLLHGAVEGVIRSSMRAPADHDIPRAEFSDPRWNYIALGHYHVYHEVAPNAFYSGSIEYTSHDIWGEVAREALNGIPGKGIIERNLATGSHQFHPIEAARRVIDIPPIDAPGLSSEEVSALIAARVAEAGIDNHIVRLVVRDIERHIIRDLDHRAMREFKRRAMLFNFDTRQPEAEKRARGTLIERRLSLREIVEEYLGKRVLSAGIDREQFVATGLAYLDQASEKEKTKAVVIDQ